MIAIGLELSADTDMAAVAVAAAGEARPVVDVVYYGDPEGAVTAAAKTYADSESNCGVWLDPMPCAGVLDELRLAVQLHELSAEDVAAAAWQFTTAVRVRKVRLGGHRALKESMRAAVPRPLAMRFAFERRKVTADMSPLNAAAFALLGFNRNDAAGDPGAWVL